MSESIAKKVIKHIVEMRESGQIKSSVVILPKGVVGKFFTLEAYGRPYQNSVIFQDGSEMTMDLFGGMFYSEAGEWKPAMPDSFKVEKPE